MKNIHILPTDKPSRLHFNEFEELVFTPKYKKLDGVNIYITSDEEIKDVRPHKGKWQLETGQILNKFPNYLTDLSECKLVIMTTDQDLIEDGVQSIPDEFLEWFVKNPSCESVETEIVEYGFDEVPICIYKISIPKEEPKQETLEEARANSYIDFAKFNQDVSAYSFVAGWDKGAKWQQERMYSEEDMEDYSNYCWKLSNDNRYKTPLSPKEWFEQFKKK